MRPPAYNTERQHIIRNFQPLCWSRKSRLLRKTDHPPSRRGSRNKETITTSLLSASRIISTIDRTSLIFTDCSSPNNDYTVCTTRGVAQAACQPVTGGSRNQPAGSNGHPASTLDYQRQSSFMSIGYEITPIYFVVSCDIRVTRAAVRIGRLGVLASRLRRIMCIFRHDEPAGGESLSARHSSCPHHLRVCLSRCQG